MSPLVVNRSEGLGEWIPETQQSAPSGGGTKPFRTIVGANGATTSDWQAVSGPAGGLLARRTFNGTTWPLTWSQTRAAADPGLGVTTSVVDIKPDPVATAAGSLDSSLAAFAASAPAGAWVTLNHEYEAGKNSWTPQQLKNAFNHAYPVMKAANPKLLVGQCFTCFTAQTSSKHYPLSQWVAPVGDFYGLDGYQNADGQVAADILGPAISQVRSVRPDASFLVCECGVANLANLPAWVQSAYDYCNAAQIPVLCFFNTNTAETASITTSQAGLAAIAAVNADSKS